MHPRGRLRTLYRSRRRLSRRGLMFLFVVSSGSRRVYDLQRTWDSQHNNVRSANWQSVLPESMYCVACTHAYFCAWRSQGPLLSEGRLEIL